MTGIPWVINLAPTPDEHNAKFLKPVRFSIRDSETYIDPVNIRVKAGYAKVFSTAEDRFDVLPRTKRVALASGLASEPNITASSNVVTIERTSISPQRSVYATSIDAGSGFRSAIVTAVLRPEVVTSFSSGSPNANPLGFSVSPGPILPLPFSNLSSGGFDPNNGVVLGMEHGPRNMAVYLRFQRHPDDTKIIRLTSYTSEDGTPPDLNTSVVFDWSSSRRYTIVWNEAEGFLEVYGHDGTTTDRLFYVPFSSIPQMPDEYYARAGSPSDITAIYGQLGPTGDKSSWYNIAVTTNVGYPVVGAVRPGDFVTLINGSELITTRGSRDPRDVDVSPWFDAPLSILPNRDPEARTVIDNGVFKIIKKTPSMSYALYREEPALAASDTEGFMVRGKISATDYQLTSASTGTGFIVFDGESVFLVQLFDDTNRKTVGILRKGGSVSDMTTYFTPLKSIDWSKGDSFRLVVDPRRNCIRLYNEADLSQSVMDIPFDRNTIPKASDFGWGGLTPFILIGHITPSPPGTFALSEFDYSHIYQAWDSEDGVSPVLAPTDPIYTRASSGSSSLSMSQGFLTIASSKGATDILSRPAEFGFGRGAIVEAQVHITSWRPRSKTGVYLVLDDGIRSYALTFLENNLGKFVALSRRTSTGGFSEVAGRDGEASTVSFQLDWTKPHVFRMERLPFDGLHIYVDGEALPRLAYPESKIALLPDAQFGGTPTIAFGQFSTEGATSNWGFVRGLFSRGFEVSFKKNKSDSILRDELVKTQAVIVTHVVDTD